MADIFADIIPGNVSRTPPFPEAVAAYRVAIESSKYLDGTGVSGNKAFIIDFKVLESSNPDVNVGDFHSKYFSLNGNEFPGALKVQLTELMTFLVAACGFEPDTAAGVADFRKANPSIEALFKEKNESLNGREMNLATTLKLKGPRAKTPGNVTLHAWTPAGAPAVSPGNDRSTWVVSECGNWLLDPNKNEWVAK